jgi:hypothetical protein
MLLLRPLRVRLLAARVLEGRSRLLAYLLVGFDLDDFGLWSAPTLDFYGLKPRCRLCPPRFVIMVYSFLLDPYYITCI